MRDNLHKKTTRILIVDDKEDNRYLLRAILQGNEYEVDEAVHGADALEKARQNPPDLIAADILMPVMDGFALCREWKKDERLKAIPFVFYTATYTDERDRAFALSIGAERVIVKPCEPDEILAIIQETLEQRGKKPAVGDEPVADAPVDEPIFLRQYNESLVRKLEDKMEELKKANRDLKRDITARRQAEDALQKSEEKFRLIATNTPDHIVVHDLNLRYVWVLNPQLGLTEEDMIGKTDFDILEKNEAIALTEVKRKVLDTGNPEHLSTSLVSSDGTPQYFEGSIIPKRGATGRVDGLIGYFRNVTERKQVEEALKVLFLRQEAILGAVPDIIVEVDTNKVYTWSNQTGLDFFGEDVIGTEADAYFLGEQDVYEQVTPLFNGMENVIYLESWQRRRDGEKRLLAWWCRVLKDAEGNVTGAISTARDITERKQAEERSQWLASFPTLNPAPIVELDKEKGIVYLNPAADELFPGLKDGQTDHPFVDGIMKSFARQSRAGKALGSREIEVEGRWYLQTFYQPGLDQLRVYSTDITERKQAEVALKESNARVRSLISTMAEGVAFHDIVRDDNGEPVDYRIVDLNPQYEEILGLRKADILGKLSTEAYGTAAAPYLAEFTMPCKTMKSAVMETYFPPMDKHFIISIAPLSENSFATIFFDVTEHKRVEEAIRASEANYRTIFDTAGDAMIVHDAETGTIVDVNRKCCEMFGYTRKEMRGLSVADISAAEPAYTQENALRWMRRAIKGRAQLFEWKGKDRSGEVFWVEISLKRATISGEHRLIAAIRDISDRKRFEEAVAARAFWEGIARTMQSGLVVLDPNGSLSYANEAFYNLVGYSCDELVSMPPPYPWMGERPHDDPLLSKNETRNQPGSVRHKSGRLVPVIVSVSDLKDAQEKTISRFAVYQDISGMVAIEEQLVRTERLALLGQLAGSIGHELRNPLGVVQSSVYYLRSKLKDQDEKIARHLDRLENSVAFSDKVITDLLSFARVPNLAKQPMAMGVFMNKLMEEFASNEKVTAVVDVETDKNIMADETQMTQLFRNLISNAYDAMPDGGQLGISIRASAYNMMEIGVSDTGQGMTEEVLAKAFEPLYTTKARGAGFGLSICRKIAESHGGGISITSEPGKGTQVLVSLPM